MEYWKQMVYNGSVKTILFFNNYMNSDRTYEVDVNICISCFGA